VNAPFSARGRSAAERTINAFAPDGRIRRLGRELKVPAEAYLAHRSAERLASEDGALIVGPWSSEVGFELLYWLPYVRTVLRAHGVPPERVIALSRGGVQDWYRDVAGQYVDLLEWIEPERLYDEQRRRVASGGQKQTRVTPFDRACVAEVSRRLGGRPVGVLHPLHMYRRFRPVWMHRRAPAMFRRELTFAPLHVAPSPPEGLQAGEYVAVKSYFSQSFPRTPENVRAARELLVRLQQETEVVVLRSPVAFDDHEDIAVPGVRVMSDGPPDANLGRQAAVAAGARALLSTYGGFSYLGPMLGVPTCAFYSANDWNSVHLELMRTAMGVLRAESPPERQIEYMLFDVHHVSLMDLLRSRRPT
jgi:hypothetical protein